MEITKKQIYHKDWFILLIVVFLLYIYSLSIAWNLGYRFDMTQMIIPAIAVLLFYIGLLLKQAKRNWFIGIRTPWTLSSDIVWQKTHQLGSRLFKLLALLILLGLFFPKYLLWFILLPIIIVVLYLIIYSYLEYQKEKK